MTTQMSYTALYVTLIIDIIDGCDLINETYQEFLPKESSKMLY